MKPGLLTHNDMDGYGCRLSFMRAYPDSQRVLHVGYDAIIDGLNHFDGILSLNEIDGLYITDLSFSSKDALHLLSLVQRHPTKSFIYVDHHPHDTGDVIEAFENLKRCVNFRLIHTERFCATYIFYKYLKSINKMPENNDDTFGKIIELIDVYDTWKTDDKRFSAAITLNDAFYSNMDKGWFVAELVKGHLSDSFKNTLKNINQNKVNHFKYLEESGNVIKAGDFLILASNDFIAHMTIEYPDFKYYINPRTYGQISVRFRDVDNAKEVKLHVLDKLNECGLTKNAGGHDTAFGVGLIDKNNTSKVVQIIAHAIAEFQGIV